MSSGAGRGGRGFGRGSLSGRLRDDHALTAAVAIGAAAGDDLATTAAAALDNLATAIAAVASRLTGTALFRCLFAVAAILTAEKAVALLAAIAAMMTGEQTTVALLAMAAVTSDRTGVTAHEGNGHECEEHRQRKTEKPLHQKPPTGGETERSRCVRQAVANGTPIRDGHRTAATDVSLPAAGLCFINL